MVLNAQHAKQVRGRKTDVGDSVWLARICQFQSHFRALKARKSHKQAIVATAHKLLRVIHSVLKNRKPRAGPA